MNLDNQEAQTRAVLCNSLYLSPLYLAFLRGPIRHGSVVCLSGCRHDDQPGEWICYTEYAGLQFSDRAAGIALKSMGAKLCFRCHLVNIGPIYKL